MYARKSFKYAISAFSNTYFQTISDGATVYFKVYFLHKECIIKCEMCSVKNGNKVKFVLLIFQLLKKKNTSSFSCLLN